MKKLILLPMICITMIFPFSFDSHNVFLENTSAIRTLERQAYEINEKIRKLKEEMEARGEEVDGAFAITTIIRS